jgi:hypothetical protein
VMPHYFCLRFPNGLYCSLTPWTLLGFLRVSWILCLSALGDMPPGHRREILEAVHKSLQFEGIVKILFLITCYGRFHFLLSIVQICGVCNAEAG